MSKIGKDLIGALKEAKKKGLDTLQASLNTTEPQNELMRPQMIKDILTAREEAKQGNLSHYQFDEK